MSEVLALQGVAVPPEAPKAISIGISVQLSRSAPAYAALPFEVEPATFLVMLARERS
ncbi:MAG TPA: hypothetical protein VLC47_02330 [Burkholderiales bacterium]|nr:hypothetical protein [Burkholderiales bacterium]